MLLQQRPNRVPILRGFLTAEGKHRESENRRESDETTEREGSFNHG
jgi:hypothetical protein